VSDGALPGEHGSSDDAQPFLYTRLNPSVEINIHPQPDLAIFITIMPKGTIFTRHPVRSASGEENEYR
jgi:hypothetical protein